MNIQISANLHSLSTAFADLMRTYRNNLVDPAQSVRHEGPHREPLPLPA